MTPGNSHHYALHQYFRDPGSMPIHMGVGTASGIVAIAALLAARFARGDRNDQSLLRLAEAVAVLWLAGTAAAFVFDLQSTWGLWPWYYYESFLVLLLGPGVILAALLPALQLPALVPTRRVGIGVAAGSLVLGAAIGMVARVDANGSENFSTQNAMAALRLNKLLPKRAVVAMGDRAGIFGYYLDRPVVQVEGIVNSNEYLDAVRADRVHAFLRHEHVTYYAKSAVRANRLLLEHDGGPDPGAKECGFRFEPYFGAGDKVVFDVCRRTMVFTLPLAHGEQIVVWQYTGGPSNFHTPG
jgi:hypothetical protein